LVQPGSPVGAQRFDALEDVPIEEEKNQEDNGQKRREAAWVHVAGIFLRLLNLGGLVNVGFGGLGRTFTKPQRFSKRIFW
jgi:hypothetical protein